MRTSQLAAWTEEMRQSYLDAVSYTHLRNELSYAEPGERVFVDTSSR